LYKATTTSHTFKKIYKSLNSKCIEASHYILESGRWGNVASGDSRCVKVWREGGIEADWGAAATVESSRHKGYDIHYYL
jgi:hypothetical protein